ncbi:AAA family ATPase [Scytonema sp. NUACC21]
MNTTTIAFFNNKGGVGKTTLAYHLAWMYSELGYRVVAVDLDPQATLSMMLLGEDRLEEVWLEENQRNTIFASMLPLLQGLGNISEPHLEFVSDTLALLTGNINLFQLESNLMECWSTWLYDVKDNNRQKLAFQFISTFWKIMQKVAIAHEADFILIDLAPSIGAINHTALIATDYIVIPLGLDFVSLTALPHLGMTLQCWRKQWQEILEKKNFITDIKLPLGTMEPIGYVVTQYPVRLDRPVKTYQNLITDIPKVYREAILNQPQDSNISLGNDVNCLALLKTYPGLIHMAQEANKPMFHLKPADGALGSYMKAVRNVYQDFESLANAIAKRTGIIKLSQRA